MTRNLLILTLLATGAAGAANAAPLDSPTSVVVNVRGLNPAAAEAALRRAVSTVCAARVTVDSADCYDATLTNAEEKLRRFRRNEAAVDAPTTLASR